MIADEGGPLQRTILPALVTKFSTTEIGLHLHSTSSTRMEKIEAAYECGCTRFDSALKGFGGCPMAEDDLTGNLATEDLISYLNTRGVSLDLDMDKWQEALAFSSRVFL